MTCGLGQIPVHLRVEMGPYHVHVDGFYTVRVQERETADDRGAPVSTLGHIVGVSKLLHHFVCRFGVLNMLEASFIHV